MPPVAQPESVLVAVAQDQHPVVPYAPFEAGETNLECARHPEFHFVQRVAHDVHCHHAMMVVRHFADFDWGRMPVVSRPVALASLSDP